MSELGADMHIYIFKSANEGLISGPWLSWGDCLDLRLQVVPDNVESSSSKLLIH